MTRKRLLTLLAAAGGAFALERLIGPFAPAWAQGGPTYDPAVAAKPVQTRPIPSSGEPLPIIGMGTAVVYDVESDDPKIPVLAETVRTFLQGGGKLIDTAPTYGRAEPTLGEILKRIGLRDQAFLATKISIKGEQAGIEQTAGSMTNLGTGHFELLQVHNIRDTATHLKTIRRMKDEGKVRYVGITTSSERSYPEYEQIMRTEKLDFIQIDYAFDNREAEDRILPLAQDRGMAVLTALPFGRGRLFGKARGKRLPEWAGAELDCTSWAQFFLKFLLSNPAVNVVIPGTDKPEYAIDNLYAGRGRIPDAQQRQKMLAYWDQLG
jgi:aryl-alcohol dehydrogenase-like predicted oxidoreductase